MKLLLTSGGIANPSIHAAQTAIKVVDGRVDVVSAGHWERFAA